MGMRKISERQARIFLAVTRAGSVSGAARAVNRSQTSVTKSIQDLEHQLGVSLFNRNSKGVSVTVYGKALIRRAELAAAAYAEAEKLVPPAVLASSPGATRFFRMDISETWLDAFLAIVDHQNIASAAAQLGLKSAAASSSIRKLEDSLNINLFERSPDAMVPTTLGLAIAKYAKLARSYMRHASDELSSMQGAQAGQISLGTLPFSRTIIVPRAIDRLLKDHSYVDVSTREGSYDDLVAALRCGDVDLIVGALRGPSDSDDLVEERLLGDQLSIIVGARHPLAGADSVDWEEILAYPWILPRHGAPTRELFEDVLSGRGLASPKHTIETSSLVMIRGFLLESDRVTVLSRHQVTYEEQGNLVVALPIDLPETNRPIGITTRARSVQAPAAEILIGELRTVSRQVAASL